MLLLSLLASCLLVSSLVTSQCPTCLPKTAVCQNVVRVKGIADTTCICSICVNACVDRNNFCPAGTICQYVGLECPIGYKCGTTTKNASCAPWSGVCPDLNCPTNNNGCPMSGVLKDPNGCDTCTCNDPCAELQCPEETPCQMEMSSPGVEPNYYCGSSYGY